MKAFSQLLIIAVVLSLYTTVNCEEKICRALALRGGGSRGGYEIGALKGFVKLLKPEDYAYDVVVGVSVGAINAALFSLYPPGKEPEALAELERLWLTLLGQDTWSLWPHKNVFGGFYKDAFLDDTKLWNMMHEKFDNRPFQRQVSWSSVDLNTGTVIMFDETIPEEYKVQAIKAGASYPGFFSPVSLKNYRLVDGGTFDCLDLSEAIVKCRELGASDQNIIVDIILAFSKRPIVEKWTMEQAKKKSSYEFVNRKESIESVYIYTADFQRVIKGYPHVQFRYIVSPSEDIESKFVPIISTVEEVQFQLDLGYKDAINLIQSSNFSSVERVNGLFNHNNAE